ncbi:MAG: insulinase family protein, partial [Candidatus Dadabacteria bacterium]|nr:insulinase family protein [Candidatus Dadabacteria bacterium]
SFDETVYYVVIASRFQDTALDILSDAMQNSTFDPEELDKELEVVVEEIRRGQDSPGRNLSEKLFSTMFVEHPYGRPVIGSVESVKSFTRKGITDFYHKWYSPQNMALVIVGDFDAEAIEPRIEETFGKLKRWDIPKCDIAPEPAQNEMRAFVLDKPVQEGYFSLAYHAPDARGEDVPALDVLANILGGGESSRLYRSIKEEKGLTNSIYAYAFTPKREGVFAVGGTLDPAEAKEALSAIIEQVARLKREPVSDLELSKAKVNIESDAIYTKETMQGQAQKLGFYEVEAGDFRYEDEYLDKVRQVTAEDVMAAANEYLNNTNLTAGFLLPTGQVTITEDEIKSIAGEADGRAAVENTGQESGSEIVAGEEDLTEEEFSLHGSGAAPKQASASPSPTAGPVTAAESGVKEYVLDNGVRVLIKRNPGVPLFAARAAFLGGLRYEDSKTQGMSNFASRMLTRGTDTRSAAHIAQEIESIAGDLQGFSGRNS